MKRRTNRLALGAVIASLLILVGLASLPSVASPLFSPPTPPGTPTGAPHTALPTFDTRRLNSLQTPVGGIDPGDEPDTSLFSEVTPTTAPLKIKEPSSKWKIYKESDIGFSFSYPQNWNLYPPRSDKAATAPDGTNVIL